MTYDPIADFEQRRAARRTQREVESRQRPAAPAQPTSRLRAAFDVADAFVYGAADTITFGYMDELGAWLDHELLGAGNSYQDRLREHREQVDQMEQSHGTAMFMGQLAGGFVPMGALTRANNVRQMVVGGAVAGAVYGSGASDADTLSGRLEGAAIGGVLGGVGGYVIGGMLIPAARWGGSHTMALFRTGRDPSVLPTATRVADEAAEAITPSPAPRAAPNAAPSTAAPTPATSIFNGAADRLEAGALLTTRELLGDPGAARAALNRRLGQMSVEQAQALTARLEKAQVEGAVIDDPHFRSLLGIDLSDTNVDADLVLRASALLEEATEEIAKKAGLGARTSQQMDADFAARLEQGVLMDDLTKALEESSRGIVNTNIANHAHMVAGVMFARAKDKYLPLIREGAEGAKEELAGVLTKAAHLSAIARGIKSNAGRALQRLQSKGKLAFEEVSDDLYEVESVSAIRARIDATLNELGDDDLKALLDRVRSLSDVDALEEVLLNPARAEEFGAWRRTMNSVSLFLRSNALTPATGLFNSISLVAHDFFRNGLAKRWAIRNFERAGRADDALAMRFELAVGRHVYWEAHRRGFKAMFGRIRWEFWSDVERIAAVGWGRGAVREMARSKRRDMTDAGFVTPQLREYQQQPRLAVADVDGFNSNLDQKRLQGGAFGNLLHHAERAKAVTANTVDALGGASMKLFTGAIDDWGRQFIKLKETYALSARQAIREAIEQGLPEEEAIAYASKRAQELAEFPPSEILQRVETSLLKGEDVDDEIRRIMKISDDVDLEAERVLFNDGPQTTGGRVSAQFAQLADRAAGLGQVEGVLLPYIRTPIRLFERGLVSYTPWGTASREVQAALKRGGVEAEIVKAQMEVGTMAILAGAVLGATGAITLTNGGWQNSANLGAGPPNRVNLPGGSYVEMGRLDPFSLTLALGGFIGQALRDGFERGSEYEVRTGIDAAVQTAWLAVRDSVLGKSYLTGLRDLMEVIFAENSGGAADGAERIIQNAFLRTVPVSGTSRQITETIRGNAPEAIGWVDNMLRAIPGGSLFLTDRMDALGDPVDGRVMGVAVGSQDSDPIKSRLRELEINITSLNRADPRGFDLTSEELSELRRIRGHEARDPLGRSMRGALEELFADADFNAADLAGKRQMVLELMRSFNEDARLLFEERNPNYRSNREARQTFADYMAEGIARDEARARARQEVQASGLPAPDRL